MALWGIKSFTESVHRDECKKGYTVALRTEPGMHEYDRMIQSIEHFYGHLHIESSGHLGLTSIEYEESVERGSKK